MNIPMINEETLGLDDPARARTFILAMKLTGQDMASNIDFEDDKGIVWIAKQLLKTIAPHGLAKDAGWMPES